MKLDEAQTKKVAAWLDEGLKLSDIQKRLESDLGVKLTYLEVRFLVDDLKLKPKDPVPPPAPVPAAPAPGAEPAPTTEPAAAGGGVRVSVDQITRPGAMVSGKVRFSDGITAEWFMDQNGRLGLSGVDKTYKPTTEDVQEFQLQLQSELQKLGM